MGYTYREPVPGDTVICWEPGENYIVHRHMLYLGPDEKIKDNLLVQHKELGWAIIALSSLSKGKFRPLGRLNLKDVQVNENNQVIEYVYDFRYDGKTTTITVRMIDGIWKIKNNFKKPKKQKENSNA